jgi:hypothetical protein
MALAVSGLKQFWRSGTSPQTTGQFKSISEIERIWQENASGPFGGLAGKKLVNVLEVDLGRFK